MKNGFCLFFKCGHSEFMRKVPSQFPKSHRIFCVMVFLCVSLAQAGAFTTNKVEKVFDLNVFQLPEGGGYGGYAPLDRFTQVGTNLWFTTSKGGVEDIGTISRFDLTTHEVVQVASFYNDPGNYTGKSPESSLLVIGDEAFFTTVNGGEYNKGALAKVSLEGGVVTVLYAFPASGVPTGAAPRSGLTQIGSELWATTSLGGTSNRGVIFKYSLTNGTASMVTNFDGPLLGGQPFAGFTQVGDAWYFTTFSGGNTFNTTNYPTLTLSDNSTIVITNKIPLGAGTLGRLTFNESGNPIVTKLVDLPGGYEQFPALEPILVGTNSLYFTSTGPNAMPGAILRYDISTGSFTNLFSFSTNADHALAYGMRPGYCGLTEWQGELYFINQLGGAYNSGTLCKFNIESNQVIKLVDFDGKTNQALGNPSGFFGTGTIVQETNRFYVYYPLTKGGVNDLGSIVRVALPPRSVKVTAGVLNQTNLTLSWTGGYPPYDVLASSDLTVPVTHWPTVMTGITSGTNTLDWSVMLPISGSSTFYTIRGQSE